MRKILSLLGIMVLSTIASTNVVACAGGEKPAPSPIVKIDLKTKITVLKINSIMISNTSQINQMLDSTIMDAEQINDLIPVLQNPIIKYFSDKQCKNDISNHNQKAGDLYVVITANNEDANYQGSTSPIKITLN